MQIVRVDAFGGPEVLKLVEPPPPPLARGEERRSRGDVLLVAG